MKTVGENYNTLVEFFRHKGTPLHCRKGELIVHADDEDVGLFYIQSGFVKISTVNSRGEEYVHVVYGPDELFPLMWLRRRVRRNVFYEALTPTVILRARSEDFEAVLKNDVRLCFEMVERATAQHGIFIDRINNLQYKFARERLVYCLLYLARRFGVSDGKEYEIGLRISHQVIASNINLSRESVGREIDRLVRKEMVYMREGHIVLRDIPGLVAQLPGTSVSDDWWGLVKPAKSLDLG